MVVVVTFFISILPNLALAANSGGMPFPGAPATTFLTLIVFHVVAGVICVIMLTRLALT